MTHSDPRPLSRLAPLALAFAAALALPAQALAQAPDDATRRQKELAAAREDLQAAARRVAELSRQAGADGVDLPSMHFSTVPLPGGSKPRLGVLLGVDEQEGVRIAGVTPDGGADKAGLKSGDRLLRIKGQPIAGTSGVLRVSSARDALAGLEQDKPVRITYERHGKRHDVDVMPTTTQPLVFSRTITRDGEGAMRLPDSQELARLKRLGPQLRGEVMRLASASPCDGEDCDTPLLADIMRWNGLNLVSLNPQLGRYFGTERGALVLSQGALPGLEAGDVILQVEGKPVSTPIETMKAMSVRKPGEKAKVTLLRDRSQRLVEVTVPERMPMIDFIPVPPAPPTPPAPAVKPPAPPLPPPAPAARPAVAGP